MPRGKYVNHKGRSRHFTSPEEMEEELKNESKKKHRGKDNNNEEGSSSEEAASASGSDEDSEEEEEEDRKAKGVESLIEIENPNRAPKKAAQKLNPAKPGDSTETPELTRREREEVEKQRAQAHYRKLHAEGRTEQARADLARLAIIKQHRAEAAARREAEKKEKDIQKGASTSK